MNKVNLTQKETTETIASNETLGMRFINPSMNAYANDCIAYGAGGGCHLC